MQKVKVESSNISEIGFELTALDAGKETVSVGTLRVTFKGGNVYEYPLVPASVFEAFTLSESKGKFFAVEIKGKYQFKNIAESLKTAGIEEVKK